MLGVFQVVDTRPSLVNSLADENKVSEKVKASEDLSVPSAATNRVDEAQSKPAEDLKPAESNRRNKMIDFFGSFLPNPFLSHYQQPYFKSQQQFYDPSADYEEEDLMSRANRRKPSNRENSPIFYVRLPPTPYMYVPGMGYISQPPTIRPMAFAPPPMPPPVVNPFINVPVNFLSNGKPTNVYEWPGSHYRPTHQQRPQSARPHKNSFLPDSKITHLKGPYVFNGRPEDIFVLPQSAPQPHPQQTHFGLNPYQQTYSGAHDYQSQLHQQHQQLQQQIPQQHDYSQYSHNNYQNHHQQQQQAAAYQQAQLQQQFGGYNPAYNPGYNSIYSNGLPNYY